ncbi:CTD phosphatase Fcp1, partial [Planoprotostelium fungivorum]
NDRVTATDQYFDAIREVNEVPFRGKRPPPPGASPSTTATLDTSPVVPKDVNVIEISTRNDIQQTEQIAMDDAPSAGEENNNVSEEKKQEEEKVTSVDTETDPNQVTAMAVDGAKNENGAIVQHETDPQETIHEEDSFLLAVKDVLCEIHRIYYENENEEGKKRKAEPKRASDVKTILRRVRRRILNGCTLLFSGIFPTNVEASSTDVWKLALNLGAKCEREFTPNITHVIGATATEKVSRAANTPSVYLVSPNWLHATDKHWRRQDEMKFSVGPNYAVLMKDTPPPTIHQAPLEDIPDVITSTRTHEVENKRQKKEGEEEMKEIEEGEDGEAQFLEKELFGSESEEEKEESQEGRGASDDE